MQEPVRITQKISTILGSIQLIPTILKNDKECCVELEETCHLGGDLAILEEREQHEKKYDGIDIVNVLEEANQSYY